MLINLIASAILSGSMIGGHTSAVVGSTIDASTAVVLAGLAGAR